MFFVTNRELIHAYNILTFQVEKFLKWVKEPMDEEASPESVSHNNVQDTCTSSGSEEPEVSVEKGDDPVERSGAEPGQHPAVCPAGEVGAEKHNGTSPEAAGTDTEGCVPQAASDPRQEEAEGEHVLPLSQAEGHCSQCAFPPLSFTIIYTSRLRAPSAEQAQ